MRSKMIAALAALALLAAACGSSVAPPEDQTQGQTQGETQNPTEGGGEGSGGNGGGGKGGGSKIDPENMPPPEVVPTTPPEGGSLSPAFKVEASGTDPDRGFSRPSMILVRSESAEANAASRSPSPKAADAIRAWSAYAESAIIAVFAGAQPDSGHSVKVTSIDVRKKGRNLTVFLEVQAGDAAASQVVSVPWAVVSVPAGQVANASSCFVVINQQSIPSEC